VAAARSGNRHMLLGPRAAAVKVDDRRNRAGVHPAGSEHHVAADRVQHLELVRLGADTVGSVHAVKPMCGSLGLKTIARELTRTPARCRLFCACNESIHRPHRSVPWERGLSEGATYDLD
jgi:hypothetical protein